jgi:ribosomal protein S12 methylthiotransferase accessory factor
MPAPELACDLPLDRCAGSVVAPRGDDLVLWSLGTVQLVLRGLGIGPAARAVLIRVDGKRSAAAVVESLPQLSADMLNNLISELVRAHILAPRLPSAVSHRYSSEELRRVWASAVFRVISSAGTGFHNLRRLAVIADDIRAEVIAQALGSTGTTIRHVSLTCDSIDQVDVALVIALDGSLQNVLRFMDLAAASQTPLLIAFEHPFHRIVWPLPDFSDRPCLECLRLRLRGAALSTSEAQAVDDAAFSWEAPMLVRPYAPSAMDRVFLTTIVDELLLMLQAITKRSSDDTERGRGDPDLSDSHREIGATEIVTVDRTAIVRRHLLLAHPFCPNCGKGSVCHSSPSFGLSSRKLLARLEWSVDPDIGLLRTIETWRIDRFSFGTDLVATLAHAVASQSAEATTAQIPIPAGTAFSRSPGAARLRAMAEALERYGLQMESAKNALCGTYRELHTRALDPQEMVLYTPEQYRTHRFPWCAFDPDARLMWTPATRLVDGKTMLVPTDFVYLSAEMGRLVQSTSNGAAAHVSHTEAALRGLCELVERDACMITWYARIAPPRLDERSLPAYTTNLLNALRSSGYRVSLRYLSLDIDLPVVLCVARCLNRRVPALLLGAACGTDTRRAALKATEEVLKTYVAYVHLNLAPYIWDDPGSVEAVLQPWQHLAFYAKAHSEALDLFDRSEAMVTVEELPASDDTAEADLSRALAVLAKSGLQALAVDYTPSDVRRLGLVSVKVLVPGLQPIHFDERFRRLGGHRLFDLPFRLGKRSRRLTNADLNPLPHPFP